MTTASVSEPQLATLARLAIVGSRTDRLRMVLSALGSAVASLLILAAINVVLIGPGSDRYVSALLDEQGLHPGVVIALLALTVPLVAFVGQCIRIGAPARDRRLAMLRMAGATGPEVAKIVAIETGIAAAGGAVLGALTFAIGRSVVSNEADVAGRLQLPTDVVMPIPLYLLVVCGVTALAVIAAFRALRRTVIDPFGVAHRHETNAPRLLPLLFLAGGLAGLLLLNSLITVVEARNLPFELVFPFVFLCFAGCGFGLALGAAALSQQAARVVRTRVSQAAWVLASARLDATPYRASRNLAAVLLAVMIGAAVQQIRLEFLRQVNTSSDTFYADTFDLLDLVIVIAVLFAVAGLLIAAAEGITERRRTLAALVATGTPRSTIARSVLAETLIPLVPGVLAAALIGTLAGRGYAVGDLELRDLPVPWVELAVLCSGAIAASLIVTAAALFLLPASVSPSELRSAR